MPNAYAMFVKNNIHKFNHLEPKERMKACAKLYHESKGSVPTAKKIPSKKSEIKFTKTKFRNAAKPKGGNFVTPTMTSSGGSFWDDFTDGIMAPLHVVRNILM